MKKCKRNAINKYFFCIKFKKWKIYFGPFVLAALKGRIEVLLWMKEITDIKSRPVSKHLCQGTQQHDEYTKPLGSTKFA